MLTIQELIRLSGCRRNDIKRLVKSGELKMNIVQTTNRNFHYMFEIDAIDVCQRLLSQSTRKFLKENV